MLTPPADLRIEQELAQIISGLRTGDMTELDRSQRIYRILCSLLFPAQAGPDRKNDAIAQAVKYIGKHLFESLSIIAKTGTRRNRRPTYSVLLRNWVGVAPVFSVKAVIKLTSLR